MNPQLRKSYQTGQHVLHQNPQQIKRATTSAAPSCLLDKLAFMSIGHPNYRSHSSMEDFDEADVLWSEDCRSRSQTSNHLPTPSTSKSSPLSNSRNCLPHPTTNQHKEPTTVAVSAPVGIPSPVELGLPMNFRIRGDARGTYWVTDDDDDTKEEHHGQRGKIVPPHLLLAARQASAPSPQRMAFSVCTGHGRTLKGRDLSQVRDLVLRLTGFLEPEE